MEISFVFKKRTNRSFVSNVTRHTFIFFVFQFRMCIYGHVFMLFSFIDTPNDFSQRWSYTICYHLYDCTFLQTTLRLFLNLILHIFNYIQSPNAVNSNWKSISQVENNKTSYNIECMKEQDPNYIYKCITTPYHHFPES